MTVVGQPRKKNQEEEAAAAASRGETGNQLAPAAAVSQLAIVETSQLLERRASSHLSLCYCLLRQHGEEKHQTPQCNNHLCYCSWQQEVTRR